MQNTIKSPSFKIFFEFICYLVLNLLKDIQSDDMVGQMQK